MTALTDWVTNIAGSLGTELALTASDYQVVVDWTLEALALDSEPSPLTSACKSVSRAIFWQYIMGLTTGSEDQFNRAKMLYEMAIDTATVYLPEINGLIKAVEFYSPYDTVLDEYSNL